MSTVKMKTPTGQIMSRILEKDVAYHLKNGWELVKEVQDKPEKTIKSIKPTVEVDKTPNEGEV